jgi:hypothetical protein
MVSRSFWVEIFGSLSYGIVSSSNRILSIFWSMLKFGKCPLWTGSRQVAVLSPLTAVHLLVAGSPGPHLSAAVLRAQATAWRTCWWPDSCSPCESLSLVELRASLLCFLPTVPFQLRAQRVHLILAHLFLCNLDHGEHHQLLGMPTLLSLSLSLSLSDLAKCYIIQKSLLLKLKSS